jgi:hypothetical protein
MKSLLLQVGFLSVNANRLQDDDDEWFLEPQLEVARERQIQQAESSVRRAQETADEVLARSLQLIGMYRVLHSLVPPEDQLMPKEAPRSQWIGGGKRLQETNALQIDPEA